MVYSNITDVEEGEKTDKIFSSAAKSFGLIYVLRVRALKGVFKMTNRENALIALDGGMPESVPCFFSSCQIVPQFFFEMPPGTEPGLDGFGVHQTPTENTGGMFTPTPTVKPVLEDVTMWKDVVHIPDCSKVDFEKVFDGLKGQLHLDQENFVLDFFSPNGLFERLHFLMGFENAMYALMEEPEACSDLAGAIADYKIEIVHATAKYLKPDYFTFLDDYTHVSGRFISDETFNEVFRPHYQRVIDEVRNSGMKFKTHCCGKVETFIDNFLDMGVTAFDPVQCVNDIQAIKKKGKIGIMGGLDIQGVVDIDGVSEEELRAEVHRCIDEYAEGGAYLMYGASVHMYNPAAYGPDGVIGIINDECAKYGYRYYA